MISNPREEILERIARSLGPRTSSATQEHEPIRRTYRVSGTLDTAACLDLLIDRLHDYGAVVYRCTQSHLRETIAEAFDCRGKRRIIVPPQMTEASLPGGYEFIRDHDLTYEEIDRSEGVLTACAVAIAMTGTIVLEHSPVNGRRALSLIPDYHLCVVYEAQVVETVSEGITKMDAFRTSPVTTISGPSATSDIEMTRINGVHGPRTLDVILVSE